MTSPRPTKPLLTVSDAQWLAKLNKPERSIMHVSDALPIIKGLSTGKNAEAQRHVEGRTDP